MIDYPSLNYEDRRDGMTLHFVVLHGTWTGNVEESLKFLTDTNPPAGVSKVSAHYLIDKNGIVYALVDESKRAWHAGQSFWRGVEDMNSASIGIEIQNAGMGDPYSDEQIQALIILLQGIMARHDIPSENILAHSDIAPARKDDPGAHFPWVTLAKAGVALWPDETRAQSEMVEELLNDDMALLNALHGWGYDARVDAEILIAAFDRHFLPETGGDLTTLRGQRLAALWKDKLGI